MAALLTFEDFTPGLTIDLGRHLVSQEEIVRFGRTWDPLPFHVDAVAAADGPYGGLIASGRHSGLIWVRLLVEAVLNRSAALGSPGIDEIRWHRPVRPGDLLHGRLEVLETQPERGEVVVDGTLVTDEGELATSIRARYLFARRGA